MFIQIFFFPKRSLANHTRKCFSCPNDWLQIKQKSVLIFTQAILICNFVVVSKFNSVMTGLQGESLVLEVPGLPTKPKMVVNNCR